MSHLLQENKTASNKSSLYTSKETSSESNIILLEVGEIDTLTFFVIRNHWQTGWFLEKKWYTRDGKIKQMSYSF